MHKSDTEMCAGPEESIKLLMDTHFPGSYEGDTHWAKTGRKRVTLEKNDFITVEKVQ